MTKKVTWIKQEYRLKDETGRGPSHIHTFWKYRNGKGIIASVSKGISGDSYECKVTEAKVVRRKVQVSIYDLESYPTLSEAKRHVLDFVGSLGK